MRSFKVSLRVVRSSTNGPKGASMKIAAGSGGFTLIEVLVAMAIMAIAFVGFFTLFSQTAELEDASRFNTIAPMLAQEKVAQVKSGIIDDRSVLSGESREYPGFFWSISIDDVDDAVLSGDATRGLKRVDVTVVMKEDGRSYSLRSYEWLER